MIVIGGSLGGCEAVGAIVRHLPTDFPLPIAVVLHRHRESDGVLVPVLQGMSPLPIVEVEDKMKWEPGKVYICPADYHLLLDDGCFSLSTDDLVNFARPSIDVLFDSAAEWHGPGTIAIVLTGASSDGSSGARNIQSRGGLVIVQDPATAEGPWMPTAAIAATQTRHVMPLAEIAPALLRLAKRRQPA